MEIPETHMRGHFSIETDIKKGLLDCDFGIQIAKDGRVWICIDGVTFIRFKPKPMMNLRTDDVVEMTKELENEDETKSKSNDDAP